MAFERETEEILERFGFDRVLFERLRSDVVAGRLSTGLERRRG